MLITTILCAVFCYMHHACALQVRHYVKFHLEQGPQLEVSTLAPLPLPLQKHNTVNNMYTPTHVPTLVVAAPCRLETMLSSSLLCAVFCNMPHACALQVRHYVEFHLEQGPQLEASGLALGVVSGIAGQTWLHIAVEGVQNHGGEVQDSLGGWRLWVLGGWLGFWVLGVAKKAPMSLTLFTTDAHDNAQGPHVSSSKASACNHLPSLTPHSKTHTLSL